MLSGLRKAAGKVGRFLSTTGKSALRKVGDRKITISQSLILSDIQSFFFAFFEK